MKENFKTKNKIFSHYSMWKIFFVFSCLRVYVCQTNCHWRDAYSKQTFMIIIFFFFSLSLSWLDFLWFLNYIDIHLFVRSLKETKAQFE